MIRRILFSETTLPEKIFVPFFQLQHATTLIPLQAPDPKVVEMRFDQLYLLPLPFTFAFLF